VLLLAACSAGNGNGNGNGNGSAPSPAAEPRFMTVENPALRLHGFRESFEIAPVLLAAEQHFPPGVSIKRGGIPNLVGTTGIGGYGDPGVADIATHAETQLLRFSVARPDLRTIMTVTEGLYRIVGRRSSGIASLADLKGKRIATVPDTSAEFFLEKMLATVDLGLADVTVVGDVPLPDMPDALAKGDVDALAIWEPESEKGALALGDDAVAFDGAGVYREIFNLNTTQAALADPEKRAHIKAFLRAVIQASRDMAKDPAPAQALVMQMSGHPADVVAAGWPHHRYLAGRVPDILDVLVEEERWLAAREDREPRDRETLSRLIDYSLLDEIMAEGGDGN